MSIDKLDINKYFYEYLLENKVTFFVCLVLLLTYPLQRVILPKYYGKVISNLQDGSNKQFIENAKMLLIIYASVQVLHSVYQKVQGILVPKFAEFSLKRIFSSLLKNDNDDYENIKIGEILSKIAKIPHLIYRYLDHEGNRVFSIDCSCHLLLSLLQRFVTNTFGIYLDIVWCVIVTSDNV